MNLIAYFQSYEDYFWQWEANTPGAETATEVIAIPNGDTISYREMMIEVLEKLQPQGIPPFGSILLAIIATNPKGKINTEQIAGILTDSLGSTDELTLSLAISFMKKLSGLPIQYKSRTNRLLIFQAIFENCPELIPANKARLIIATYHSYKNDFNKFGDKEEFDPVIYKNEFGVLAYLDQKFEDQEAILANVIRVPEISHLAILPDEQPDSIASTIDFVSELIENVKTFQVGTLIKQIWTGLNIPLHSLIPSEQPLGGISDLSNKGDFDRLLLSEFANDDLVFLSRLANQEALYLQREMPPLKNKLKRIILIDISLKNWGTPRTLAFAVMLAISRHPKTDMECLAFVIGDTMQAISTTTVDELIQGLQLLDGSLHAANGLTQYFEQFPSDKNTELFLLSSISAQQHPAMQKALSDYAQAIQYYIYLESGGGIDIYKNQQRSRKHIQYLQLPLERLWAKSTKATAEAFSVENQQHDYPILFKNSLNSKCYLSTPDGAKFQITGDRSLLQLYSNDLPEQDSGWDMIWENLPFITGEIEIGLNPQNEHVLLLFKPQNRQGLLLNLQSGHQISFELPEWKSGTGRSFIYHDHKFYHANYRTNFSISTEGHIENDILDADLILLRVNAIETLNKRHRYINSVLKNILSICINQNGLLCFNTHYLYLNEAKCIKLDQLTNIVPEIMATKTEENLFVFPDGSCIQLIRAGMLILQSSNPDIPKIYVPSILNASLGIATTQKFAGNKYYYKSKTKHNDTTQSGALAEIMPANVFFDFYIYPFIQHIRSHASQN